MPVKFLQKEAALPAIVVAEEQEQPQEQVAVGEQSEIVALVDGYMELRLKLEKKMKALEKDQATMKKYEEELKQLVETSGATPETEVELVGSQYALVYGPKTKQVVNTNLEMVREILGLDQFLEIADVSVGNIRKYLNPKQQEQCLVEDRIGSRRMKPRLLG